MKTGLRDCDDMKRRLEELELADGLNRLLLQHTGEAMDEFGLINLLETAFAEYIVEADLPSYKMAEFHAKMTNYIEATAEDPDLTESACLYWVELNQFVNPGKLPEDICPF